jgi:hypothetical protein
MLGSIFKRQLSGDPCCPKAQADSRPYKSYTAILTQEGTQNPVPTILENTLGDIVWERISVGVYRGTLEGVITEENTVVFITNGSMYSAVELFAFPEPGYVHIEALENGLESDGWLWRTSIDIRVYP